MDTEQQAIPETFTNDAGAEFMRRAMVAGYDVYFASDACIVGVVSAPFERLPFEEDPWLEDFFTTHRRALTFFLRVVYGRMGALRGPSVWPGWRS